MTRRIFWGTGLLVVGLLLLASNLGYIGTFSVWSLWPLLIIWPALRLLTRRLFVTVTRGSRTRRLFVGRNLGFRLVVLWVLAGATAQLLNNLGLIAYDWGSVAYWSLPILLVGLGLAVMLRPRRSRRWWLHEEWVKTGSSPGGVSSFVGDLHYGSRPWVFKSPMTIDLFAGDTDLDLSTAQFSPGDNYLYVTMWAGELDIRAPEGIDVDVQASCSAGELRVFEELRSGLGLELHAGRPAGLGRGARVDGAPGTGDADGTAAPPRLFIIVDMTFGSMRVR